MSGVDHNLSDKPIPSRKELVERMIAAFGKPDRVNAKELIWRHVQERRR